MEFLNSPRENCRLIEEADDAFGLLKKTDSGDKNLALNCNLDKKTYS